MHDNYFLIALDDFLTISLNYKADRMLRQVCQLRFGPFINTELTLPFSEIDTQKVLITFLLHSHFPPI